MTTDDGLSSSDVYDVAVIGGGVVGTAVLRALAGYELSVVLLEARGDLGRCKCRLERNVHEHLRDGDSNLTTAFDEHHRRDVVEGMLEEERVLGIDEHPRDIAVGSGGRALGL